MKVTAVDPNTLRFTVQAYSPPVGASSYLFPHHFLKTHFIALSPWKVEISGENAETVESRLRSGCDCEHSCLR